MSAYYKLIGALVGNVVAVVIVFLAYKGFATCTVIGDASSCSIFGISTAQVTAAVMAVFNSAFVHYFPANTSNS